MIAGLKSALEELSRVHPGFGPELRALVAVSGGRDSVCLLHALVSLGWRNLVVCHLNHGLRGRESDEDAAFVTALTKSLQLKSETTKSDVARAAKRRSNSIELAGREARDAFLERMVQKHGTPFVFLAHHADDQAETVLGNLFRGTGLGGLSGMSLSTTDEGLIKLRPLLSVRRATIDEYIRAHAIAFREDSTNALPDHRRNRIRHELLPLLGSIFDRDVTPIIGRVADHARRDQFCLDQLAREFARNDSLFDMDGSLRLTPELAAADPAIQSRILIGLLVDVAECTGIGSHEIESALAMLKPGGPAKINLPGNRHLRRKARRLWVE